MKMINGDYIQSKWVDAILIRENVNTENDFKLCKDSNYYVLHKEELFQLKFEEINCALNEKSLSETRLIAGKPETAISSQA